MSSNIWSLIATCIPSLAIGLLTSSPATAAITQQIFFEFDPTPTIGMTGDENIDSELITGQTEAEINRSISASIIGNGYSASGSVGMFGSYGLMGRTIRPGHMRAQVLITADLQAPPVGGLPREAIANFLIDGGNFRMVAGPNSTASFTLTLDADNQPFPEFQSSFDLTGSGNGLPTLQTRGADIGATLSGSNVEIPFSFQSVSLGILTPGQVINFEYQLDIIVEINDFSEITTFEFQDPLTIVPPIDSSLFRPTISFVTAIPEPSSCLALSALSGIMVVQSRRRRH